MFVFSSKRPFGPGLQWHEKLPVPLTAELLKRYLGSAQAEDVSFLTARTAKIKFCQLFIVK